MKKSLQQNTHEVDLSNLTHKFLIATPQMPDPRFARTLVYVCRHDEQGVLGIVINKPMLDTPVGKLLDDLDVESHESKVRHELAISGGPIHPEVGFVLHTGQPTWQSSFAISENICITTSKDVLESVAVGNIRNFHLCLGHVGWSRKQVEKEIKQGDWLIGPADLTILFDVPFDERWRKAGEKLDVNLDFMSPETGFA